MLECASGTIFGREVVPEVWRMSATSPGSAGPGRAAAPIPPRRAERARAGFGLRGERNEPTPSFSAARIAGDALPASTISARALRSSR